MKKAKRVVKPKRKPNPHARALASALFRARAEKKPGEYRRRTKHVKRETEE
jgi:stalled ribosome alternative rescue factor ArfA